jgi:hypothetical protein
MCIIFIAMTFVYISAAGNLQGLTPEDIWKV